MSALVDWRAKLHLPIWNGLDVWWSECVKCTASESRFFFFSWISELL